MEARFEARLMESQRTQVRYGFRNDQWLIKNHGQRKAEKIMTRKRQLGLRLGEHICSGYHPQQMYLWMPKAPTPLCSHFPASSNPQLPACPIHMRPHAVHRIRTIPDPEFPGEDEHLFFVMVEFNIDDIKELRRVTQIELTGTLDADGVRAFVEATCHDYS